MMILPLQGNFCFKFGKNVKLSFFSIIAVLKDEPDDLTHLAPVAGDVCVPLDDHPFLTDMFDDFLLKDNSFGPLLTDEPSDPFISYRDYRDSSPQLLSPNLSKVSRKYKISGRCFHSMN